MWNPTSYCRHATIKATYTNSDDPQGLIEDAFLKSLEEQRKSFTNTGKKPHRKAIQVQAVKSVTLEDLPIQDDQIAQPSTSGESKGKKGKTKGMNL